MTLMELFVCMSILAIVGSSAIFSSHSMINRYQFETSAHRLAKELEWSRKVSLNLTGEIEFLIEKVGDTLSCQRCTEQQLTPNAKESRPFKLNLQKFQIGHIPKLLFEGQEVEKINIIFDRTGVIVPSGEITLISRNQNYVISLNQGEHARIFARAV